MATLIVTFARITAANHYVAPLADGSGARTETLTMPDTSSAAVAGEEIVELLADADCLVAIGPGSPDSSLASDGTGAARKLLADTPYQFRVAAGDKVAVEAA